MFYCKKMKTSTAFANVVLYAVSLTRVGQRNEMCSCGRIYLTI